MVTKVKIAELQSSLDSKAAFAPLHSLPRKQQPHPQVNRRKEEGLTDPEMRLLFF